LQRPQAAQVNTDRVLVKAFDQKMHTKYLFLQVFLIFRIVKRYEQRVLGFMPWQNTPGFSVPFQV